MNNTTGASNTAIGDQTLTANTTGNNNTAIGDMALQNSQTTNDNVCIGTQAGSAITTANNNIIIGHHSGVHTVFGQESDRCFIDNIHGAPVSAATAAMVMVDSDGRLGTVASDGPELRGSLPKNTQPHANTNAVKETLLNQKVQNLQAIVVKQQQQIEALTAQLKEQAAEIQKASEELETSNEAGNIVVSKR
jgi:hypothetical protein